MGIYKADPIFFLSVESGVGLYIGGNMSENTLIGKLSEIQKTLKAPKNQYNKFGKYNYRSCEDIVEGVKPHLKGLILTLSDEMVLIGNRYYIKATASITDNEKTITANGFAREAESQKGMSDAQVTGSTSSYARKYALNGLFCIDDTKDSDTDENKNQSDNTPVQKATEKQIDIILKLINETGVEPSDKTIEWASKLSYDEANKTIKGLEEKTGTSFS